MSQQIPADSPQGSRPADNPRHGAELDYRLLADCLPHMIWSCRADGYTDYYNRCFLEYSGKSAGELEGWGWTEVIHPDDRPHCLDSWNDAVAEGRAFRIEYRLRRADGRYLWHEGRAVPQRDEAGRIVRWFGTCTEIDSRKSLEEKYRRFATLTSDYVHFCNRSGDELFRVRWVEGAVNPISGYSIEDILAQGCFLPLIHPDDREAVAAHLLGLLPGDRKTIAFRLLTKEKKVRWVSHKSRCEAGEAPGELALFGAITDITERKRIEQQLQASEERFRSLMDLSPDIVSIIDKEGILVYNSPAALAIHGYTQEEMIGRNTFDLIHPDDQARCLAYTDQVFNNLSGPHSVQYRYRNKDGSYVWMEASASSQLENPHIQGLIVISRDISERKRMEDELRLSEEMFSKAFHNKLVMMTLSDLDSGKYIDVNEAFSRVSGFSREEAIGRSSVDLGWISAEGRQALFAELKATGRVAGMELALTGKGGDALWCEYYGELIVTAAGPLLMSIALDITERKRTDAALATAKDAAEEASRAKSEFLANMSHEIRTPINGIMGMAQLLEYTELSATQKDYLAAVRSSSENLLSLVSDILDLSKIEAGKIELERKEFSLRATVSDVVRSQIAVAHGKGLALKTILPAEVPDSVSGDQLRIKQILLNLLGNAIKFTHAGEVSISVTLEERQDDTAVIGFAVADTGIGIRSEVIERIFAPFGQADASTTRQYGGSGLGLAICARLAELMGGSIEVESREGVGSTFRVRLPLAVNEPGLERPEPVRTERQPLWAGEPLRVLLVEDNEVSRMFFVEVLKGCGHRVDIATNGGEALESWERAAYDLILMDVQMPVMDGLQAVARIRALEKETAGHVPIIALTAHAMEGDRRSFLARGFDGYVSKPTRIRTLIDEMQRCLALGQE